MNCLTLKNCQNFIIKIQNLVDLIFSYNDLADEFKQLKLIDLTEFYRFATKYHKYTLTF
jgi:hypothetical protein